ncbi:MAG: DUF4160 domain-containing protein [Alphaproteobacteria bacterium]|nr:DUF4160 domain-containing protein [Alphaproteobacteria bacterium]MCW5742557.1 DUF4160 domain-containing protein [Alphaproteobacteria bacterium]
MPTISAFFGILIRMYYRDHAPPHFHAVYGEQEATIDIETLDVLEGRLSRRALELVLDWAELHQDELRENWHRARAHEALKNVAPLE